MAKAGEMGAGNIGVSNDEQGNIPHDNKHIDKTIETVNFFPNLILHYLKMNLHFIF